jgi:hypothetical protein
MFDLNALDVCGEGLTLRPESVLRIQEKSFSTCQEKRHAAAPHRPAGVGPQYIRRNEPVKGFDADACPACHSFPRKAFQVAASEDVDSDVGE